MVRPEVLEILRCPQDKTPLAAADSALVAKLNAAITAKQLTNVRGEQVVKQLDGGLIREAGDLLYPILDQIPVMLPDEAIDVSSV